MTDYGKNNQQQAPSNAYANAQQSRGNDTALMIEGLYNGIAYDLQKMKKELMNELKYNSMQSSSVYQSIQKDAASASENNAQTMQSMVTELKYGYQQNQTIYESLSSILNDEVIAGLDTIEGKVALLEEIDKAIGEIREKLESLAADGEALAETVRDKVTEALPAQEEVDYDKIAETVTEKTETCVAQHSKEVLDAVAAIPVAENVDYARIVEEVSDKVVEKLREGETAEETVAETSPAVDYDRIIYGAAEKVVESLPYPDKVDYRLIDENFKKAAEELKPAPVDEEAFAANVAAAVAKAISEMDIDALAEAVAARIVQPEPEAIDYDKLSDMIVAKLPEPPAPETIDYELLAETVIAKLPEPEPVDYDKLADAVVEKLPSFDYEKVSEIVAEKVPVAETLDYAVLAETVAERLPAPAETEAIDYDRVYQAAKAAEPVYDGVDYERIAELVEDKLSEAAKLDYDLLAEKVASRVTLPDYDVVVSEEGKQEIARGVVGTIDYEDLAQKIAEKVVVPEVALPEPEAIDYELISDKVAEKIVVPEVVLPEPEAIDYEFISDKVAEKVVVPQPEPATYDVLVDEDGAKAIAESVAASLDLDGVSDKVAEKIVVPEVVLPEPEAIDYDALAEKVAEKIVVPQPEQTEIDYEKLSEEVAEKLRAYCPAAQQAEETAEEVVGTSSEETPAEESAEETVGEAPVEEAAEEAVETSAEATSTEETAEETSTEAQADASSEIAFAEADAQSAAYEEAEDNNLIDADTGLVIRLKRSFTAKLKQSSPEVKDYYSRIKNELVSFKRLNSNISWHGDRFNYGRETVARMNICGKTLCFYVNLDPTDPAYKTTVYHQRDVSGQKAYAGTPFMVKVKSDAGAKKAVRLVGILAEKLAAEKRGNFETVNYAEEFCHASTKQLLDEGLIKVTKEKKVVLNF